MAPTVDDDGVHDDHVALARFFGEYGAIHTPLCRRVSLSNWKDLREGLLQDAIEGPLVKLAFDTAGYVAKDQF